MKLSKAAELRSMYSFHWNQSTATLLNLNFLPRSMPVKKRGSMSKRVKKKVSIKTVKAKTKVKVVKKVTKKVKKVIKFAKKKANSSKLKSPLKKFLRPNPIRHAGTNKFYPAEEQGIEKEETPDEKELHMKIGEDDEDIYDEKGRIMLEEDDEIKPWEEGFAAGAFGMGQLGKDALTGEPLMGVDTVIEMELNGKVYRFVSEKNALKFKEKKEKEKRR